MATPASNEVTTGSGVQASSTTAAVVDAVTCALLPGYCVARAATVARDRASAAASETVTEASALAGGALTTAAGSLREAVRESVSPVSEISSSVRYASVAATVGAIALIVIVLVGAGFYVTRIAGVKP